MSKFLDLWRAHPWAVAATLMVGVAGLSAVLFKVFS